MGWHDDTAPIRDAYVKQIKERIFELEREYYKLDLELVNRTTTVGMSAIKDKQRMITDEIVWRMQDYDSVMFDRKRDWDLNYKYDDPPCVENFEERLDKKFPLVPLNEPTGNNDEDMENFRISIESVACRKGYIEGWYDAFEIISDAAEEKCPLGRLSKNKTRS